jgi:hypothetical protein
MTGSIEIPRYIQDYYEETKELHFSQPRRLAAEKISEELGALGLTGSVDNNESKEIR